MRIERQILGTLLHEEEYTRRVLPFLQPEYVSDQAERWILVTIADHVQEYGSVPSRPVLATKLESDRGVAETIHASIRTILGELESVEPRNVDWLVDATERFCQERALYNAMSEGILIADGDDPDKREWGSIPGIITDALSVGFDDGVGYEYLTDAESQWEWYTREEERVPFDIELLNEVTRGGFPSKTINIFLGGTGFGKTLIMCHMAANNLKEGRNVLYVTFEMSEAMIGERIDANLMDVEINSIVGLGRERYMNRRRELASRYTGRLVIQEYPTAGAHVGHIQRLLSDLWIKRSFRPDVIYVDYINIMTSFRYRKDGAVGSYFYVKSIVEELRGLAVEQDVPLISGTQLTRSGFNSSDPDLDDTSESFGVPATADFMAVVVVNDELREHGQCMMKILKSRYNRLDQHRRFLVGMDTTKMRLYDVDNDAGHGHGDGSNDTDDGSRRTRDFSGFE